MNCYLVQKKKCDESVNQSRSITPILIVDVINVPWTPQHQSFLYTVLSIKKLTETKVRRRKFVNQNAVKSSLLGLIKVPEKIHCLKNLTLYPPSLFKPKPISGPKKAQIPTAYGLKNISGSFCAGITAIYSYFCFCSGSIGKHLRQKIKSFSIVYI